MGYMHIDNLYKVNDILLFRECYALEKIHGTSANVTVVVSDNGVPMLTYSSGGASFELFKSLFNAKDIEERFKTINPGVNVTLYGEAYGGSQQGMSAVYGKQLKFIVFDVKIGDSWLAVPQAEEVAKTLGLEFVWYTKTTTDLDKLNELRDRDSEQAIRNGVGPGKKMEGVVLRPLIELTKNNGSRIIVKHKRDEFKETKTPREVSPEQLAILSEANAIADEWVTEMRMNHVLDKLGNPTDLSETGKVVRAMVEDVKREGEGEIVWSKEAEKAIGKLAAEKFKARVRKV